jgi:hypothetical protein
MRSFVWRKLAVAGLLFIGFAPSFEPVQPDLFKAGGALANAWADYDNDGDLDLFVGFNGTTRNKLYQNNGGTFTEVAATAGVADSIATRSAAWSDYDADGDIDLLIGVVPPRILKLYRNDGGRFSDATTDANLVVDSGAVRQFSFIDLDSDLDLDLFVALRDKPNLFFRNDNGRFTNIAAEIGLADARKTVGAVWFDYDQDGDLDLYVANQDGDANGLFVNTRGKFRDFADGAGVQWGGRAPKEATNGSVRPCVADVNNDGWLDLFLANYGKNGLFLNMTTGYFRDVSADWGIDVDARFDSCAFADIDHDGLLDLYVNGTVTGGTSYRDYLYHNMRSRYADATPANIQAMQASHGVQWADFDQDGDLDLAIAGTRADATHSLFRNQLPALEAARSLQISVVNPNGRHTLAGAEVRVFSSTSRELVGSRLIDTGSGYNSQNVMPVHVGIPFRMKVDVEIAYHSRSGRRLAGLPGIDPEQYRGKVLQLQLNHQGRLVLTTQ